MSQPFMYNDFPSLPGKHACLDSPMVCICSSADTLLGPSTEARVYVCLLTREVKEAF